MRRLAPTEGWLTAGLLAGLVYTTLRTIDAAGWGERVGLAPPIGLFGVAVGLLAAKSRLRAIWALPISIVIGAEAVLLTQALVSPGATWAEKLGSLSGGLQQWSRAALAQGTTHDPLVFAVLVGGLGYLLGICSSWLVFRLQDAWWPLVLNGALGLVHLSYATVESIPSYLFSLFLGVLMVASLELHVRRSTWRAIGLPVQGSSTAWTLAAAAGLTGLALIVALQLPAGDINAELASRHQALAEPWRGLQRQVDTLFGGGKGQGRTGGNLAFSQSLAPRADFDLGTQPVLKIASPQRYYWRTATYDRYDGRSIQASGTAARHYQAGEPLPADADGSGLRRTVEQKVTVLSPGAAVLFAAGEPTSFSLPVVVDERQVGWDFAALRPAASLQRGQTYTVTSSVAAAGRRELAETSAAYPDWIERYLELPSSLPDRVGQLSGQIPAERANTFDRALAIEAYLRGLTYSTHTTVPPADRDWVDYLVFDSREGYCDYYATAMAVMLRTQGIPARVASGFAPGTFDEQEKVWIVRESEAHSWTEAYFPDYGWVMFEPSALRPTPERPESGGSDSGRRDRSADTTGAGLVPDEGLDRVTLGADRALESLVEPTPIGRALIILAALVLVAGVALSLLAMAWERGLGKEPIPRRRYAHLRRWLSWGGSDLPESATPYELAGHVRSSLPELAEPLGRLVQRHVETTYGRAPSPDSPDESESVWQSVRWRLARAMLKKRLGRLSSPTRRE